MDLAPLALSVGLLLWRVPGDVTSSAVPAVCLPPVLSAVWMQFRLGGVITRLAERSWREQIALTPLPPAEFLTARIRPRERAFLILIAAPLALHFVLLPFFDSGSMDRAPWFMVHLTLALTLTPLTFWGAADQLARMCASGTGAQTASSPVVWSLLGAGAAVVIIAGGAWLHTLLPGAAFYLVFVALIPVLVDLAVFAADRRRDAVRRYDRFE